MPTVDLRQKLVPPDYRNLAINPSGETTFAASWVASNGIVTTGSTATTPVVGTGVVEYEVTQSSSLPYYVSPFGPDGVIHHGAFEISSNLTVSARVSVRAPVSKWVQLQARYLTWTGTGFAEIHVIPLGVAVQAVSGSWTTIERFADTVDVPTGATHWQLLIALSTTDPGLGSPTPPAVGVKLWVDRVFIPDSGVNLSGVTYVDGDQANCFWEDQPNFSTSRTGTIDTPPDEEDPPDLGIGDTNEDLTEIPEDAPDPENPDDGTVPPDPVVVRSEPAELQQFGVSRADAERIVGEQLGNRRLCLNEDIQLTDLVFNRMDDDGVIWMITDIEGWWTLPEPDVPDMPRGWDDGSYEARGRYQARTITLNGTFFPRSRDLVSRARDRLIQAANLCHRGDYLMTHEFDYTRGSKVWLSGAPMIATVDQSGRTDFSIGLRAPDPVKYGLKDRTPPGNWDITILSRSIRRPGREYPRDYSDVTGVWKYPDAVFGDTNGLVTNDGNTFTYPVFTLKGPTTGPIQIINTSTNQTMRVNTLLYASEQLVIDNFTKQVTLNRSPNRRFYLDVDTDWIILQPGPNRFYFLEEDATTNVAELKITWRPGWIG